MEEVTVHVCVRPSFMQKKGVTSVFKARAHSSLPLLSPLSSLCCVHLNVQVEAGVSQLNIYTVSWLLRRYCAAHLLDVYDCCLRNSSLLTFRRVLLAQLMYND